LLLPALFAGFSLVAMVLLQLGLYRPALVLPLGLIGAAVAALGVGLVRPEPLAGSRLLDGAAVLVVLGFAVLNVRYSAQNISVFRDPAAYAVTGQWLVHHGSLPIPVEPEVFGAVKGVSFYSAAFDPAHTAGFVYPQYSNLLPGLLAVAGWLDGDGLLLKLNPLIGSAALLGFYGLVRQYTARVWALVAVIVLGVSLPQLHFSRNTYSEPVTMLFSGEAAPAATDWPAWCSAPQRWPASMACTSCSPCRSSRPSRWPSRPPSAEVTRPAGSPRSCSAWPCPRWSRRSTWPT
jgi:hypothetical protein